MMMPVDCHASYDHGITFDYKDQLSKTIKLKELVEEMYYNLQLANYFINNNTGVSRSK